MTIPAFYLSFSLLLTLAISASAGADDAEKGLVDIWGNPPGQDVMSMLMPVGLTALGRKFRSMMGGSETPH